MHSVLFDSSVYIEYLQMGNAEVLNARFLPRGTRVWLSAVVLEELLAGATGRELVAIERLRRDFAKLRRLVVPTLDDWTSAAHAGGFWSPIWLCRHRPRTFDQRRADRRQCRPDGH